MTDTVLILGATGRFGRHAARAFDEGGWRVRRLSRPGRAAPGPGEAIAADARDADALSRAASGARLIVNALNPPYPDWAEAVPRLTEAVITAARRSGAGVMLPGNVYNYGSGLPAVLTEKTPMRGDHAKARIRIEMEDAYRQSGVPTTVLRAGDFIDDQPGENWFEGQIAARAASGRVTYPGPLDAPHAWAYLPDLARAAVTLAAVEGAPRFHSVGFPGYTLTGAELLDLIDGAMGRRMRRAAFPWLALRLAAPFSPMMREVLEIRYLWNRPHQIDGDEFTALLPDFRPTSPEDAIRASLAGIGALSLGAEAA